jgi:hypothetical protein
MESVDLLLKDLGTSTACRCMLRYQSFHLVGRRWFFPFALCSPAFEPRPIASITGIFVSYTIISISLPLHGARSAASPPAPWLVRQEIIP